LEELVVMITADCGQF